MIGLGLFGSFGNDLRGFDYRFGFAMENLVASMVSVVIIVQRNEGNCFSGFQAMCEFTPTIDDGFTLRLRWRRKRGGRAIREKKEDGEIFRRENIIKKF